MADVQTLASALEAHFGDKLSYCHVSNHGEVTIEVSKDNFLGVARSLRDEPNFSFEMLMDVCGVDYLKYGVAEWETDNATSSGFERGVEMCQGNSTTWKKPRFAVVYHLLSIHLNHRLRVRVFAQGEPPVVDSVVDIWNSANWFEREAFDLFGILFSGHPDLRRILTDYGFIGHPFRKDFPLSGNVEMRYDAREKRIIYEPVSIQPRVLVPKVIRQDHRYIEREQKTELNRG